MDLSLSKLPWWGQIGAFVLVCGGAVYGFWHFYVAEMQADISARETRLTAMRADITRGVATARRLPEFESQVAQLEQRLENLKQVLPEERDVADILRRIQGLATQSNLAIQSFKPLPVVAQSLYAEVPYRLPPKARTTTSASSSIGSASSRESSTSARSRSRAVGPATRTRRSSPSARRRRSSCRTAREEGSGRHSEAAGTVMTRS